VDHGQTGRHHLKAQGSTPPRRGSAPDPTPLHWRSVAARLLIVAVLLLGLVIGTGLSIIRLAPGSDVEKADTATVQWLAGERTETLDAVSGPAAELGNTWVVIGVALAAALLAIAVLRRRRFALVLAVALIGELAIFLTTTVVIDRPRPPVTHLDAQLPPTSSFPSGHTAASICLYGTIAALALAITRAWWRWLILTLAILVIVAVALARLYRGAHFPTDVMASVLFAVPWLLVTLKLLRPHTGTPSGERRAAVERRASPHDESADLT
jgi:membrane-associated phospholipid phosphatase